MQQKEAGSFLETPAIDVAARDLVGEGGDISIGRTVSHYRLVGKVAAAAWV
jgi:hypothetical protein